MDSPIEEPVMPSHYGRDAALRVARDILAAHDAALPELGDEWTVAMPAGVVRAILLANADAVKSVCKHCGCSMPGPGDQCRKCFQASGDTKEREDSRHHG